jgi:hypothetical protein
MRYKIRADISNMIWLVPVLLLQQPVSQSDQIRAAMAASLEKQLASVHAQAEAVGAVSSVTAGASGAACSPTSEAEIDKIVTQVSEAEHVDAAIVRTLARHESSSKPCDAKQTLEAGIKLLRQLNAIVASYR